MNKLKWTYILCFMLCCGTSQLKAQQVPFYCHYFVNPMLYNPAMTGYGYQSGVYLQHRSMYGANYDGAPVTNVVSFETSVKKRTIGLGGIIYNDKIGLLNNTGVYFNYAYKIKIDKHNRVLFGASGGLVNSKINFSEAVFMDDADPTILNETKATIIPDINAGAYYLYKNAEAGISFPQLLGAKGNYNITGKNATFKNARNFYATLKYNLFVSKVKQIKFSPLLLLKANSGKFQYDFNGIFSSDKYGWAGLVYKSNYALGFSAGAYIKNLLVGYQYEFPLGELAKATGLNHEILLALKFGKKEIIKKTVPRSKY